MQEFKAGDKVRCIDARESHELIEGKIYTVVSSTLGRSDVRLVGPVYSWRKDRFELYEGAAKQEEFSVESAIAFLTSQGYTVSLSKV